MTTATDKGNTAVKHLLNGTYSTIKSIVPIDYEVTKPQLLGKSLQVEFGVIIGFTGDVKGQLILAGEMATFAAIGEIMFGMPLEGDMLASFSGELGNMLAGGLATNVAQHGVKADITSPTIMQGSTNLSGYEKAIHMRAIFTEIGALDIYLLLN